MIFRKKIIFSNLFSAPTHPHNLVWSWQRSDFHRLLWIISDRYSRKKRMGVWIAGHTEGEHI